LQNVLLVEDDAQLGEVVKAYLEVSELSVEHCETASEALMQAKTQQFSCVVLDLNLPDEDGLVVLRKLKQLNNCPVIICSARCEVEDRIVGLEFGAEDYLPKPFSSKELMLRIHKLIALTSHNRDKAKSPKFAHYLLDEEKKSIWNSHTDTLTHLTLTEFHILSCLVNHPGKVYTRGELIDAVSGVDGPENDRAIDVAISRLRKKIETDPKQPELIKTSVGFGYYLAS